MKYKLELNEELVPVVEAVNSQPAPPKDMPLHEYKNTVPNLMEDLGNLPSAFVVVGTMDCLREEGIEYAKKLAAAGNQVELHILPGLIHPFDFFAPEIQASKNYWKVKMATLKRAFEQH